MRVIDTYYTILGKVDGVEMLKRIEFAGRVCWKSEDKITDRSYEPFVRKILSKAHESVMEHEKLSVVFVCDRGITHEIVRHRIASYSMESTRYCNYAQDKFGNELTFIRPSYWAQDSKLYALWEAQMRQVEQAYFQMIELGAAPQEARAILPHSLKAELVATMNLRQWRHFFKMRGAKEAHPQIRELVLPLLAECKTLIPVVFDDIVLDP